MQNSFLFINCVFEEKLFLIYIVDLINFNFNNLLTILVDTIPPTIQNCPSDILRSVEFGASGTSVSWTEPTAVDASGVATLSSRSHSPGTTFPVGSTTVLYRFVDGSGNQAECSFTVTVSTGECKQMKFAPHTAYIQT